MYLDSNAVLLLPLRLTLRAKSSESSEFTNQANDYTVLAHPMSFQVVVVLSRTTADIPYFIITHLQTHKSHSNNLYKYVLIA